MKKRIGSIFAQGARPPRTFGKIDLTLFLLTWALAGCGGTGFLARSQVLTPPPSAPRSTFFVEKPDVQSREVGDAAWQRNAGYADLLARELRAALQDRGKTLADPPADRVRSRVYVAFGKAPVKQADRRRTRAHVEIRLQLVDPARGAVLYSTHTLAPIEQGPFGWGPEVDEIVREALRGAAQDFASRL